ncbi:MAG TPA: BTAD domain-containing putative transcriptional regulator [Actinocrinis sp.]|nr:BTAD domain-containing putative transcriptional regulator [Actinocrinis sp.]
MRFGLLGTVVVERDGALVEMNSAMPRTVLAALLLHANTIVPVQTLIEVLWGGEPPASVTASLQNHVMRLRRLLGEEGGARIRAVAPGYLIEVRPGELDLDVFAGLTVSGRLAAQSGDWDRASADLGAALALWRGDPAADVPGLAGHRGLRRLARTRLRALGDRIEADLELGRHRELIGELGSLVAEHPLREGFHRQLMLALYRADRQAEALEVFQRLRRRLAQGLGAQPSVAIRRLHGRILNADPGLAAPSDADRNETGLDDKGSRLPADTRAFTGRERELDRLMALVRQAPEGNDAGMVLISAIDGMGGIGKTSLAVHAAHRVRDQFPDGRLFLDLRGYTSGAEALTAEEGLDRLLRSRGVPPQLIPADLGERAAFYRDRLAGTRTLIILDNAGSAAQVRPLLPGGPGCLVLITSRRRLPGLDDAHWLALDVLTAEDAIALAHKVAGPGRIPAHHPAVAELVELCGRMPLAVQIAAARLRRHQGLRIEDVVGQLRDDNGRLDRLGDEEQGLATVFDRSYQDLAADEQRLFRLLGQIPGPDFDPRVAAAVAGIGLTTALRLLETLVDHNLLTQHCEERYRFHELVRLYARSLGADDPAEDRDGVTDRLLDYYEYTARDADRFLARHTRVLAPSAATPPAAVPCLTDRAGALAWMRAERDNLTAAIAHAAARGRPARVVALTAATASFLQQEGPWAQAAALHQAAAAAARELGDRLGEATALYDLARARQSTGDAAAALGLNERALELYQALGDRQGEANALWMVGRLRESAGAPGGVELLDQSLALFRQLGDRLGEANVHTELGRVQLLGGDLAVAAEQLEQAGQIYHEVGDRLGRANALWELGRVRIATGDLAVAADLLEECREICARSGHRLGEASALTELGRLRVLTGPFPTAARLLEQALVILRDFGYRLNEAATVWELGRLRLATGEHQAAAELLEQALALFKDLDNRHGQASVQADLGRAYQAAGRPQTAAQLYRQALATDRELGLRQSEIEVLNNIAALVAETDGPDRALPLYRENLPHARDLDNPMEQARALEGMAHCADLLGDPDRALADQRTALALYRRIGAVEAAAAAEYLDELCRILARRNG